MVEKTGFTVSRRRFLQASAAAPVVIPGAALGLDRAVAPSERITMGGIGIRNRGGYVLSSFLPQPDVQFVAIADVRADRRAAVKEMADQKNGDAACATYRDFRELLARDDIDAVLIATGDRWHSLVSMMAAEAGKDIYSEKPCAISIDLCQRLCDTIVRTGRVFQAGTQRRSISNFIHAAHLAHSGQLGNLQTLHASIYRLQDRNDWLPAQPEPPRDEIDWNMWLGPAPWRPYNRAYVDGAWRGHHDFDSGAKLLDWGAHTLDLCQWAKQADDTMPIEYEPIDLPDDNAIACRYADGVKLILRRSRWMGLGTCPIRYEGDEGWVETGDTGRIAGAAAQQASRSDDHGYDAHHPRSRLPQLCEDARADCGQRAGDATLPHRLPRGSHRLAAWSQVNARSRERGVCGR
jgi:GFO/IDH/MocA oxidoreductase family protein